MFVELHIIGDVCSSDRVSCRHPFLGKLLDEHTYKNVVELYRDYINERYAYFEGLWVKMEPLLNNGDSLLPLMFHPNKMKWKEKNDDYYRSLGERYVKLEMKNHPGVFRNQPIMLPNGLFDDYIRKYLIVLLTQRGIAPVTPLRERALCLLRNFSKPVNVTLMVEIYHKCICEDEPQEFYSYNRTYELFAELNKGLKQAGKPEIPVSYDKNSRPKYSALRDAVDTYYEQNLKREAKGNETEAQKEKREAHNKECEEHNKAYFKKLFNEYQLNERALNRLSIQDMILFYLSLQLTKLDKVDDFKLKDVKPNAVNDADPDDEENAKHSVLSRPIPFPLTMNNGIVIQWNKLRIKDYSRVLTMKQDLRIPNLIALYKHKNPSLNEISAATIEREFERFDLNRCKIFEKIFEFESKVRDKNFPQIAAELAGSKGYVSFQFIQGRLNEIYADATMATYLERMSKIRNCFAHNNYIEEGLYTVFDVVEDFIQDENGNRKDKPFADMMYEAFDTYQLLVVNML